MVIVGIDYSMSCPALTIHLGEKWSFDNCKFCFLTHKKKYLDSSLPNILIGQYHSSQKFYIDRFEDYLSEEDRFYRLARQTHEFFTNWANIANSAVFIEGYSFGSKGKVFEIGEACGALKSRIWEAGYEYQTVPPTVVKKFASGKGNAKKDMMHESFLKETQFDISEYFGCGIGKSPGSDIVDSYYIAKYGFYLKNDLLSETVNKRQSKSKKEQ